MGELGKGTGGGNWVRGKIDEKGTNASWDSELSRAGNGAHVTRKPELGHVLLVLLAGFAAKYQTVLADGKYMVGVKTHVKFSSLRIEDPATSRKGILGLFTMFSCPEQLNR